MTKTLTGWTFHPTDGSVRNGDGDVLASVPHAICGGPEDLANGRLMARVPRLRLLLLELMTALGDHHTGQTTTRPFPVTYRRDEKLLKRAADLLAER